MLELQIRRGARMRRLAAGVSVHGLAALLLVGAAPAFAQSADQAGDQSAATDEGDKDIIVTGYAASLQSAVSQKKAIDQVVESITAEDIGRLPDASIAESIARLPGLTSQRLSGRSNVISIRGLGPDFSTTLLNGREQTSTGDNRAVEYDQYPAEIINQVLVYKTPMASIIGQGLAGTVNLKTIRPLQFGKRVLSVGARGTYADLGKLNAGSREFGYRVNGLFVDQFKNDEFGISLSASYTDEPYQTQEFNAWGYATTPQGNVIGGSKSYVTSSTLKRLGLQGTLEWRVSDTFTSTFDAFYTDFKDDQIKRGIELPLGFDVNNSAAAPNATKLVIGSAANGLVTSGTFSNVEGVVRNDVFQRHAKLYSFGWNGAYDGGDGWRANFDVSYSRTDRNELVLESYAGTGRGQDVGAVDTISFTSGSRGTRFTPTLNYGDYNLIRLTSPLGWGGNQTGVDGTQIRNGQDGYYNDRIIDDELWQFRAEVERDLNSSFLKSVQFGLNYTTRSKSLTPDEYFLGLTANTDGLTSVPVPENRRLGTTNQRYLGLGPVISYNPLALLRDGVYQRVANPYGDVIVKSFDISEKLLIGYGQLNIRSELGASELTGNVGVQVIATDQKSRGAQAAFLGTNPNGSPNIGATPRNDGDDYVDVLPSLNLSLRLPSDFVIRLGAAREIVRSRIDDLRASLSYELALNTGVVDSQGVPAAVVRGNSGNPLLRPWRANAVDLTFEKYFGETKGYLAVQLFYKDLKTFVYEENIDFDFTGLPVPPPGNIDPDGTGPLPPRPVTVIFQGDLRVPINGKGGSLYGVEVAGTLPFGSFIPALDGFGVNGGVSYTKSKIRPSPNAPASDIPGYSRWVANGTAFFEKWGFNVRGSVRYRSSFIGEVSGFGAARVRRRALAETIVDAQIGYDFQETSPLYGLALFIQGQNLTDEPFRTINPGQPQEFIDFQTYGRRFMAGFNYKF
jgi:iron complex outermembrane recepter protein